jgi:hypothetical protein
VNDENRGPEKRRREERQQGERQRRERAENDTVHEGLRAVIQSFLLGATTVDAEVARAANVDESSALAGQFDKRQQEA